MRFFSKHILTGLLTVLPVVLSIWLLYWLAMSCEQLLGSWLQLSLPEGVYKPGMGVLAATLGLFLVGLLMHALFVQRLFAIAEKLLYRTPVIKSVYGAISDFFVYFSPAGKREFDQVVAVEISPALHIIGFVTRSDTTQLPAPIRGEDNLLVYLPLSYAIGGYTLAVPRAKVQAVDMSLEDAMRFTLTGGVTGAHQQG